MPWLKKLRLIERHMPLSAKVFFLLCPLVRALSSDPILRGAVVVLWLIGFAILLYLLVRIERAIDRQWKRGKP